MCIEAVAVNAHGTRTLIWSTFTGHVFRFRGSGRATQRSNMSGFSSSGITCTQRSKIGVGSVEPKWSVRRLRCDDGRQSSSNGSLKLITSGNLDGGNSWCIVRSSDKSSMMCHRFILSCVRSGYSGMNNKTCELPMGFGNMFR